MTETPELTPDSSDDSPVGTKPRVHARRAAVAALAWALGGFSVAAERGPDTGRLTIYAGGFAHARGHAVAKLFAPGDNVLGPGRCQVRAAINHGVAMIDFADLPAGRYAVVVFHDENDNGVIDHGLLGPSEPLGFSGGFVLSLFSGRPDFEQLKFDFKPPEQMLEIRVR